MTLYQPRNPVGYRNLMTWKQAGEIYRLAKDFSRNRLSGKSDWRLINHINDSARSVQRNIEEGFKRATTKEYLQFLGFSRASPEELKGDFEELKREWKEGIRWGYKGKEGAWKGGVGKEGAWKEGAGKEGTRKEGTEGVGTGKEGRGVEEGCVQGRIAAGRDVEGKETLRQEPAREIKILLDLIYGEDCMMGRQIKALEEKMVKEKTLPRGEAIKRAWGREKAGDDRFWRLVGERFGIIREERGVVRVGKGAGKRVNKGADKGIDRGLAERVDKDIGKES